MSPLLTIHVSCSPCHTQGADRLRERVYSVQDRHAELLEVAAQPDEKAMRTIGQAVKNPDADQDLVKKAQAAHRKAQRYFDWISAGNRMGFRNPQGDAQGLGFPMQFANEAIQATQKAGAGR